MQDKTVTIPDWIFNFTDLIGRNWVAIIGILLIALASVVVTELVKRKVSVKQGEARVKKIVRWTLLAVTSGFTTLGYVLVFLQDNQSILSQVPVIAEYIPTVIGVCWMLYQFRLRKDFKAVTGTLDKWSNTPVEPMVQTPVNQETSGQVQNETAEPQSQQFRV